MAEREPTVIERMAVVYDETYNPSFDEEWDPVEERNKAMLAAVRELEEALRFSGRIYAASGVQEMRIEHERRAGAKVSKEWITPASSLVKLETCRGGSIVVCVTDISYMQETRVSDRMAVALTMKDGCVFEVNHSLEGMLLEINRAGGKGE